MYIFTDNSPTKGNSEVLINVKKANGNQDDAQGHSGSEVRCTVSKFIPREFSFWLKATNKSGKTKLFSWPFVVHFTLDENMLLLLIKVGSEHACTIICMSAYLFLCVYLQSGSHSVTCETASVPSPPTQCGIPVLTCKSPTCVVVSWEVRYQFINFGDIKVQ